MKNSVFSGLPDPRDVCPWGDAHIRVSGVDIPMCEKQIQTYKQNPTVGQEPPVAGSGLGVSPGHVEEEWQISFMGDFSIQDNEVASLVKEIVEADFKLQKSWISQSIEDWKEYFAERYGYNRDELGAKIVYDVVLFLKAYRISIGYEIRDKAGRVLYSDFTVYDEHRFYQRSLAGEAGRRLEEKLQKMCEVM